MQRLILILTMMLSQYAYSYECKSVELKVEMNGTKKEIVQKLKGLNRQDLFQGLLFEISNTPGKKNPARASLISNFLIHSEADGSQRAFIELLSYSSEVEKGKIKPLKLSEICELNAKVLSLKKQEL